MTRDQIERQFAENFPTLPVEQRTQMVEFEMEGLANSEFVGSDWCRCEPEKTDGQSSYYRRANGRHGWFHDQRKGGCGGITQTG